MEMSDHGLERMGSDVLRDLRFHCRPPEPPGYDEHGSFDSRMA